MPVFFACLKWLLDNIAFWETGWEELRGALLIGPIVAEVIIVPSLFSGTTVSTHL